MKNEKIEQRGCPAKITVTTLGPNDSGEYTSSSKICCAKCGLSAEGEPYTSRFPEIAKIDANNEGFYKLKLRCPINQSKK